ncbi:MAG: hypothetical protein EKK40_02785 [Bradyrhizobiaceae bacterium]|nr:MAG: hypothetical protein EKK40_02785 [Bradyrhizobiaceae bacterium]
MRLISTRAIPRPIRRAWLKKQIEKKWQQDVRYLPLKDEHRDLYDIIHRFTWKETKTFPDLVSPRSINDKMQWLKLFDQTRNKIFCSDKIRVRDYVERTVGPFNVPQLYQTVRRFSEIEFSTLPPHFVIKTNHDSGTGILVKDRPTETLIETFRPRLERALANKTFGWDKGEWAYRFIEPRILVEEYLSPQSHDAPPDFKFFCIEGNARFCHYIRDRYTNPKEQVVDLDGNDLGQSLNPEFKLLSDFVKPDNWLKMIEMAESVSREFKFVRVDMYNIDGRIAVGEMTMWPQAGMYRGNGQKVLGELIDFDLTTVRPPILHLLLKQANPVVER